MNQKRAKKLRRLAVAIAVNNPEQARAVYKKLKTIKSNKNPK